MDDPPPVRRFERQGDLPGDRQRVIDGKGAARDPIRERRTVDELHHQRVRAAGILETVNLRDVRMIEGREDLRLLMEACEALGARGESWQQHLECHVTMERRVARPIHLSRAARAE